MNFSSPVPCSDDVAGPTAPLYQTGQEVSSSDMQTDASPQAQNVRQSAPPSGGARTAGSQNVPPSASATGGATAVDTITITGREGRIETKNLAGVLQPGGSFILGNEFHANFNYNMGAGAEKQRKRRKNKYRLTDSQEEPVIRHLDVISAGLAEDWRHLGRHFGLPDPVLDQIRMDFLSEGQHEINYRMLLRWKQDKSPVTLQMLARALVEIGRGDLADELCKG